MNNISIGDKKYNITCHASCYREYADIFNRNIIKDLDTAEKFVKKQFDLAVKLKDENKEQDIKEIEERIFNETINDLDSFIDCITRLCWICIYDNNPNIENYDKWYSSLERLSLNDNWIMEVLALCANCFR